MQPLRKDFNQGGPNTVKIMKLPDYWPVSGQYLVEILYDPGNSRVGHGHPGPSSCASAE